MNHPGIHMIRLVHCVNRHPDLSAAEFRRYWNSNKFSDLLERMAELSGAHRVRKSLTLLIDINQQLMRERRSEEPFDAMFEIWWDNARELELRIASAPMLQLLDEMEAYQRQFIDFARSRRFFTEWSEDRP